MQAEPTLLRFICLTQALDLAKISKAASVSRNQLGVAQKKATLGFYQGNTARFRHSRPTPDEGPSDMNDMVRVKEEQPRCYLLTGWSGRATNSTSSVSVVYQVVFAQTRCFFGDNGDDRKPPAHSKR